MKDFHLIRNRFHYLSENLSSPSKIKRLLEGHTTRVSWQIRRIYRARNTIVHAGITPTYTHILIENLLDYLDIIMSTIVKLASDGDKVNSIEQGFRYVRLQYDAYLATLKDSTIGFDADDIHGYFVKFAL